MKNNTVEALNSAVSYKFPGFDVVRNWNLTYRPVGNVFLYGVIYLKREISTLEKLAIADILNGNYGCELAIVRKGKNLVIYNEDIYSHFIEKSGKYIFQEIRKY